MRERAWLTRAQVEMLDRQEAHLGKDEKMEPAGSIVSMRCKEFGWGG